MQITLEQLRKWHGQIDTPALLIDHAQLEKNIDDMQQMADAKKVRLRPHIKTHKSSEIARMQLAAGAAGITVAKIGEAEIMANAGIDDIFVANQITHPLKLDRLERLHEQITISVGIDHERQIQLLQERFRDSEHPLPVLIEINSGLNRCGVNQTEALIRLATSIATYPGLKLQGIFTHAGHVYAARSEPEIARIGSEEGRIMAEAANQLRENGFKVETVSVGSTPTAPYASANPLVNEVRPGNYVFYDNIQLSLGVCRSDQFSLAILATVISQPAADRLVMDAGSKAINLDRGAHAVQQTSGFGRLVHIDGEICRLSEEHGVIQLNRPTEIAPGTPVLLIPNHACAVANLYEKYHVISGSGEIAAISVDARGKSQ